MVLDQMPDLVHVRRVGHLIALPQTCTWSFQFQFSDASQRVIVAPISAAYQIPDLVDIRRVGHLILVADQIPDLVDICRVGHLVLVPKLHSWHHFVRLYIPAADACSATVPHFFV